MADSFFCLGIGDGLLKVVDAKLNQNQFDIQSIGHAQSEPNFFSIETEKIVDSQHDRIDKLISGLKVTKKNVGIVIPDSVTYSQILEMPRLNEKELISAIKYQADQFIPMPIEETNIDLEILSENEKENKILVLMVAAPKKVIEKIQKVTELSGLIPESIENELSATSRFLSGMYKNLNTRVTDGIIVINIAFNSTSLYYFNPLTALVMQTHTFNVGYSLFIKEVRINLNTDDTKAIDILSLYTGQSTSSVSLQTMILPLLKEFESEIKRFQTLINDKYRTPIRAIYIINDVFRFAYLPMYLQNTTSVPTTILNPYPVCKKSNSVEAHKQALPLYVPTIGGNLR